MGKEVEESPEKMSSDSDHEEASTSRDTPESEKDKDSNGNSHDGSDMDLDIGNFIRIRTHGDGIFEDDGDEEDEDDAEMLDMLSNISYSEPESECAPSTSTSTERKRKQDMVVIPSKSIEFADIQEMNYDDFTEAKYDGPFFNKKDRVPLYLLNPNDFKNEPKKQLQIRRAIITYRHHQQKKAQIFSLTEENQKLREHLKLMKMKMLELSGCGCQKNRTANLELLNVEIPVVSPRVYIRGSVKSDPSLPYSRLPIAASPAETLSDNDKVILKRHLVPQVSMTSGLETPRPFINIASTRLQQMLTTSNVNNTAVMRPVTSLAETIGSRKRPFGIVSHGNIQRPSGGVSLIKRDSYGSFRTESQIKLEPAPSQSSSTLPTASQLLFGSRLNKTGMSMIRPNSQLGTAIQSAVQSKAVTMTTQVLKAGVPSMPTLQSFQPGGVLKTPSGQLLRVIQTSSPKPAPQPAPQLTPQPAPQPPPQLAPQPAPQLAPQPGTSKMGALTPRFQPILPKPPPLFNASGKRNITKEELTAMWKKLDDDDDDDDDDEMAIIAAINGTLSPEPPLAQQRVGQQPELRQAPEAPHNRRKRSAQADIELNNYADIVFEEAD